MWIKAVAIVLAKSFDMVVRLGGFHSLMSFLGSLGRLMDGSGLEKLLEVVYGKNTIVHIFSGKAIARALRGHFLVDAALNIKLIEAIISHETESGALKQELTQLETLYGNLISGKATIENVEESEILKKLKDGLVSKKASLAEYSRTSKLWIQYMEYIR